MLIFESTYLFLLLGTSGSRKKSPAPSSRRGSLRRPSLFDEGGDEPTGISLLNRRDPSPRAPSPSMKLRRGRPSLGGRTLTTVSCNFELLQVFYFLKVSRSRKQIVEPQILPKTNERICFVGSTDL